MLSDKFTQIVSRNVLVTPGNPQPEPEQSSRSDDTIRAIKAYMIQHQLHPGDQLPTEATLCAQLGVSRSSVREALRRLEALDIVTVQQGRGSFVGEMTLQPLMETLFLKNALDPSGGKRTLRDITQARIALDLGVSSSIVAAMAGTSNPQLHDIVARMLEKTAQGQLFPDEDIAFHQGLLAYLENDLISQLVGSIWFVHQTLFSNLDSQSATAHDELMETARSHGEMLHAAETGDFVGYIAAVHRHYAPLQNLISQALGS